MTIEPAIQEERPLTDQAVAAAFSQFPGTQQKALLALRTAVLDVAAGNPDIGPLEETLKWGQPSYAPTMTKSGTPIRLGWSKKNDCPALYVHCQTSLINTYKELYANVFEFEGNRALLIKGSADESALRHCIELALTYYRRGAA